MKKIRETFRLLTPTDFIVVAFQFLMIVMNAFFAARIEIWYTNILINISVIIAAFLIAWWHRRQDTLLVRLLHYLYLPPVVLLSYSEMYYIIRAFRPQDYDDLLIAIDRFLFGTDPTHVLHQISFPLLTEILQIIYGLFYFLPMILALHLFYKKQFKNAEYVVFMVMFGYFLYYICYLMLPAIGPRFTLHDFAKTNEELPGLLLTNWLREITNSAEYIPFGTPNPHEVVHRDVFPSGHTMLTALTMYLAVKLKSPTKYFLIPVGVLLIFSTVYLRYHYVIDLIAGFALLFVVIYFGRWLYNRIRVHFKLPPQAAEDGVSDG